MYEDEFGDLFMSGQEGQKELSLFRKRVLERLNKIEEELSIEKPVPFKKLHPNAIMPKYQHNDDACFDFYALIDNPLGYIVVEPNDQYIVPTGISCAIPKTFEIQARPRSGPASKAKITITNSPGTVDEGYRGEIKIIIYNLSNKPFPIQHGDRIAQGKLSKVFKAKFVEVDELDSTERGSGGFGSTGV